MGLFNEIDLEKLFDQESEYGEEMTFDPVTDELIERAEKTMGYRIPASYRELLKYRNGGAISEELDESWLSVIYGISPDPNKWGGSAGHDMYYMDYRATDDTGEPRIVRVDNEFDNEVHYVAENLVEFIRLILQNEEIEEEPLGPV